MKQYHFAIVVSVDDAGKVVNIDYDAECPIGSSDGWVWNDATENWESGWDAGADTAYDEIQKTLASAE